MNSWRLRRGGRLSIRASRRNTSQLTKNNGRKRRANFLTESPCAAREMFLIKRPFFFRRARQGRLLHYGQTKEKEEFR